MKFGLDDVEQQKCNEWLVKHTPDCPYVISAKENNMNPGGAIGGLHTYSFTPTGIGVVVKVVCSCGESVDLTDYDSW